MFSVKGLGNALANIKASEDLNATLNSNGQVGTEAKGWGWFTSTQSLECNRQVTRLGA